MNVWGWVWNSRPLDLQAVSLPTALRGLVNYLISMCSNLPVCVLMCCCKCDNCVNFLSQISHLYGLIPAWIRLCCDKYDELAKHFWHCGQRYGLGSCLWTCWLWISMSDFVEKIWRNKMHYFKCYKMRFMKLILTLPVKNSHAIIIRSTPYE